MSDDFEQIVDGAKTDGELVRVRLEIGESVYSLTHQLPPGFPIRYEDERAELARRALALGGEVAVAFARHFEPDLSPAPTPPPAPDADEELVGMMPEYP